jgi:hypothetical protein
MERLNPYEVRVGSGTLFRAQKLGTYLEAGISCATITSYGVFEVADTPNRVAGMRTIDHLNMQLEQLRSASGYAYMPPSAINEMLDAHAKRRPMPAWESTSPNPYTATISAYTERLPLNVTGDTIAISIPTSTKETLKDMSFGLSCTDKELAFLGPLTACAQIEVRLIMGEPAGRVADAIKNTYSKH